MTDITLNDMKFACSGQQLTIPFDPPMKSLREARERVVQLDKDALKILGRSDIPITSYIPPYSFHPGHVYNFAQCLLAWAAFSSGGNFRPGSLLYDNLLFRFPGFANFSFTMQPYVITFMLVVHFIETIIMIRKLWRHGLTPLEGVWWAWVASCYVEGLTSFKRLDWFLEEKRKEKEAKKH